MNKVSFSSGGLYMTRSNSTFAAFALVCTLLASGCSDTQKSQAAAGCKASYIGREKAACDMGVNLADGVAKKADGKTPKAKYQVALGQCSHLEKPLVSFCVSGVNKYRAEIAKLEPQAQRQVASHKTAAKKSRMPASVK